MKEDCLAIDNTDMRYRWLRPEVVFLIGLVISVYLATMTMLPVRGEESRWARVAAEMLESGDWIVPRQQGLPFLDRPPLGPWAMALVGWVRGHVDLVAVRLPSVLAILATTLLVYGYSCRSLSRLGAFAAGVTYASFGLVLQIGWTGENEAVYTLLLAGALLLWHWGDVRSWPAVLTWSVGYGLAALATLVKGPQAPIYFLAVTTVYLLLQRRLRRLVSLPHLAGIGVFLLVLGLWLVPFYLASGWHAVVAILTRTSAVRYGLDGLLSHLAMYPLEVGASLVPGVVVLAGLLYPRILRQLGDAPAEVRFALTAVLVTFPTVWLAQEARPRYFMPLFPCVAVLVGWAIERLVAARPASAAARWWQLCMAAAAAGIAGFGVVLLVARHTSSTHLQAIALPPSQAVLYAGVVFGVAGVLVWAAARVHVRSAWVAVMALAVFQGLLFRGVLMRAQMHNANDMTEVVAHVRASLPADIRLVSFGPAHHRFAYYYEALIPQLPWPRSEADVPPDVTYFCFDPRTCHVPASVVASAASLATHEPHILPFAWEQIARLDGDRNKREIPEEVTIVGRILRSPQ